MTVDKFVIDRSKWRTGNFGKHKTGTGETRLLNKQGYMCCLGFYSKACGFSDEEIESVAEPKDLVRGASFDSFPEWFFDSKGHQSNYVDDLMDCNDEKSFDPTLREQLIKEKFAEHDVEVLFEGEYEE